MNPQGASALYKRSLADGSALLASGLFFIVDEAAGGSDSTMNGVQIGYDSTAADTGYSLDVSAGRARNRGDWRITYDYSVAETDAVLAAFSHDNIGLGTNYRLHALTLDYVPLPKTLISAIWYHYEPYSSTGTSPGDVGDWLDRVRLAFLVSF